MPIEKNWARTLKVRERFILPQDFENALRYPGDKVPVYRTVKKVVHAENGKDVPDVIAESRSGEEITLRFNAIVVRVK